MARINLTHDQIDALADALGLDGGDIAAALHQANADLSDEPESGESAPPESAPAEERLPSGPRPAGAFDIDTWIRGQAGL